MIKLIQDAIFKDDNFYNLVIKTAGEDLRPIPRTSLYRFYMRGSSSVAMYTTAGNEFPLRLTSDIDMMVLVNPELKAAQFNAIRGLLFYRIVEVLVQFSESDNARYFAIDPDQSMFDEAELSNGPAEAAPRKRLLELRNTVPDQDPLTKYLFKTPSTLAIGNRSAYTLRVNSDISYVSADGTSKSLGIGLIEVIPRSFRGRFSILDIAIPKLNFYQSQQPDISRIYYEWLNSMDILSIPINVPRTRKVEMRFALRKPQKSGYDKYIVNFNHLPDFSEFSVAIPVLGSSAAEIDNQLALDTTTNEAKKEKRKAIAGHLAEKLAQLKVNRAVI